MNALTRQSSRADLIAPRDAGMIALVRHTINLARSVKRNVHRNDWPDDRLVEILSRGATTPTTFAGATALHQITLQFVASLVPVSAAAALIATSLKLTFDRAAQISLPSLTLPHAAFIGEGKPIPVVSGTTTGPTLLDPFKLATIVSLTNEMIFNTNAEAIVSAVLTENIGVTLDAALLTTDVAVSGVRPAGLLHGVPPLTASAATTPLEAMIEDIQALALSLAPVAGGGLPVLVAAPAQAAALALRTPRELWPVLTSNAVPDKTVIGIVPSALATAIEVPRIEAGAESAIHMEDTTPADIGTPGTPAVVAAPVYSMYQKDSVALRFILPTTWALRSPNAVAWIQTTGW